MAHGKGLFAQHGIKAQKPVLFRSWAGLAEAFLSGQVNLIHVLSPMSVWMCYGSRAPRCEHACRFAGANGGDSVWYSIHNIILQQMLRQAGLAVVEKNPQAGQVRLTVMAPSDMVAALAAKQIGGFIVAEPFNALAEAKGVDKILRFSGDIWRDHACCLSMMHDHDIQSRPDWVQGVINALVDAASFAKHHRAVLQREPVVWQKYERSGAIRHAEWQQRRVDFQPFPFQSYSELLVRLLKETYLAGVNTFLHDVQPEKAARELFTPAL